MIKQRYDHLSGGERCAGKGNRRSSSEIGPSYPLTCDYMVTYNEVVELEHVFKALADHHRRDLLDRLSQKDGQTLTELCAQQPMTRYGVMKHLDVLEEAGLITTRKMGREKMHYLNPAPLQGVAGWVEGYRRFWEESMDRLEELLQKLQEEERDKDGPDS